METGGLLGLRQGLVIDPRWDRLMLELQQSWDWQQRVVILAVSGHQGLNTNETVTIRSVCSRATLFLQLHIQTDASGEGGSAYDAVNFRASTRVDCRADRQQDHTITRNGVDRVWVYVIPVFQERDGSFTKFDGVDAADQMSFIDLGGAGTGAFTQFSIWSIMHLGISPIGVPFPGSDPSIIEGDRAMMLGAYSGYDYV